MRSPKNMSTYWYHIYSRSFRTCWLMRERESWGAMWPRGGGRSRTSCFCLPPFFEIYPVVPRFNYNIQSYEKPTYLGVVDVFDDLARKLVVIATSLPNHRIRPVPKFNLYSRDCVVNCHRWGPYSPLITDFQNTPPPLSWPIRLNKCIQFIA